MKGRRTFIGMGSNLGDSLTCLRRAAARLEAAPGIEQCRHSSLYRTQPWGNPNQPPFLNLVSECRCFLEPGALLDVCLAIENDLGRRPAGKWGPRHIDLDVLLMEGVTLSTRRLSLPHPHLTGRLFVLVPLAELAPGLVVADRPVEAWIGEWEREVRTWECLGPLKEVEA
jgi:2-amino-4-hydroxy-6-hydroxymethyldihydropteridine diphosphokinase